MVRMTRFLCRGALTAPLLLLSITFPLLAAFQAAAASFTPLGYLPVSTQQYSAGYGVAADGSVVVGHELSGAYSAVVWRSDAGVMAELGSVAGGTTQAVQISDDASTTVGSEYVVGTGYRAIVWKSNGPAWLPIPGGASGSYALGISADGSAVAGWVLLDGTQGDYVATRWAEGGQIEFLETDTDLTSASRGISADGSVVVGTVYGPGVSGPPVPFRWTSTTGMQTLPFLTDYTSGEAMDVSGDGNVVIGENWDNFGRGQGYRWAADGSLIGLGLLPGGTYTEPQRASYDGSVIVGSGDIGYDDEEAFVWTEQDGLRRLVDVLLIRGASGLDGWSLEYAFDVSPDGQWVVGMGTNPAGHTEAFLANLAAPVPLPAAAWLFGGALAGLGLLKRRQARP